MKGRIREYIQCDVGHGDSALFDIEYENSKEEKETRFILVDVGDKKGNQFEDLKNCVESHKEEKPIKTSIKITHLHSDHIGGIDKLLKMNHKDIEIESISFPEGLYKVYETYNQILEGCETAKIIENFNNSSEIINTMGWLEFLLVKQNTKVKDRQLISEKLTELKNIWNNTHKGNQEINDKRMQKKKDELCEYFQKEIIGDSVEKKGCFSKSEILEFSKRATSMLKTMSKIKEKNISVQKDSTQQKIEEYGVEITKIPFEKDKFRTMIRESCADETLISFLKHDILPKEDEIEEILKNPSEENMEKYTAYQINRYLVEQCEVNENDWQLSNNGKVAGNVAGKLIRRALGPEVNMTNTLYYIDDGKNPTLIAGDQEIPHELYVLNEINKNLQRPPEWFKCSNVKVGHHLSTTSNCINYLKTIINHSLENDLTPVLTASLSKDDLFDYQKNITNTEKMLGATIAKTTDGSFRIKYSKDGKDYVMNDLMKKRLHEKKEYLQETMLKMANVLKEGSVLTKEENEAWDKAKEKVKIIDDCLKNGVPLEEYTENFYQKFKENLDYLFDRER